MHSWRLVLFVTLSGAVTTSPPPTSGLVLYLAPKSFDAATVNCLEDGGTLAVLEGQRDETEAIQLCSTLDIECWIMSTNNSQSQPLEGGACVFINATSDQSADIEEADCQLQMQFICEFHVLFSREFYYFYHSSTQTWYDAQHTCANLGGYLTSITSDQDRNDIHSTLEATSWIGLHTEDAEDGPYIWFDGFPFDETLTDEVSDSCACDEACGVLTKNGTISLSECSKTKSSICEIPHVHQRHILFEPGGSYQWKEAEGMCLRQGGHLSSYHTPEQLQLITSLDINSKSWLGGRNMHPTEIIWSWSDGSTDTSSNTTPIEIDTACLAIDPQDGQDVPLPCDSTLTSFVCSFDIFHQVFSEDKTYADAEDDCANNGGHLVSILSSELNKEIVNLLPNDDNTYWIGLNSRNRSCMYQWTDGSSYFYRHNLNTQDCANDIADETCVVLRNELNVWIWDIRNCLESHPFICAIPMKYMIHPEKLSAYQAVDYCTSVGGSLPDITDISTKQYLETLAPQEHIQVPEVPGSKVDSCHNGECVTTGGCMHLTKAQSYKTDIFLQDCGVICQIPICKTSPCEERAELRFLHDGNDGRMMKYSEAQQFCISEGGRLASVETLRLQDVIISAATSVGFSLWLGRLQHPENMPHSVVENEAAVFAAGCPVMTSSGIETVDCSSEHQVVCAMDHLPIVQAPSAVPAPAILEANQTHEPSSQPITGPSSPPTLVPTNQPTTQTTQTPDDQPSYGPTTLPSYAPTSQPADLPSVASPTVASPTVASPTVASPAITSDASLIEVCEFRDEEGIFVTFNSLSDADSAGTSNNPSSELCDDFFDLNNYDNPAPYEFCFTESITITATSYPSTSGCFQIDAEETLLVSDVIDIRINATNSSLVFTFMIPFTPLQQSKTLCTKHGSTGLDEVIDCKWYDEPGENWSEFGCETVYTQRTQDEVSPQYIAECKCTHLTAFAIVQRAISDQCAYFTVLGNVLWPVFAVVYAGIFLFTCIQLRRVYKSLGRRISLHPIMIVHTLIAVVAICHICISIFMYTAAWTSSSLSAMALIWATAYALTFFAFSTLVFTWVCLWIKATNSRKTDKIKTVKRFLLRLNYIVAAALLAMFACTAFSSGPIREKFVMAGSCIITAACLTLSIGFPVVGFRLVRAMRRMIRLSNIFHGASVNLTRRLYFVSVIVSSSIFVQGVIAMFSAVVPNIFFESFTLYQSIYLTLDVVSLLTILYLYLAFFSHGPVNRSSSAVSAFGSRERETPELHRGTTDGTATSNNSGRLMAGKSDRQAEMVGKPRTKEV